MDRELRMTRILKDLFHEVNDAVKDKAELIEEVKELDVAAQVSWQGQYGKGDKNYPTIMLEVVASQDLWIWHEFFGVAGANNDINVLDNSSLFDDLLKDTSSVLPYVVNGVGYEKGYYL
nr:protein ALP1-like [Tanacetum cinerariifolium]